METMDKTQRLNRTIPCSNCGEVYSISYKRCPFCGGATRKRTEPTPPPQPRSTQHLDYDEEEMDWTPELEGVSTPPPSRGGKRLKRKRGFSFGRALLVLISFVIVAAASYIVVTKMAPLIHARFGGEASAQAGDGQTVQKTPIESSTTFRLLDTKVTLTQAGETKQLSAVYEGEGEKGTLGWKSSDAEIVAVSMQGELTALKPGDATISVVREDGLMAQCEVSCIWDADVTLSNLSLNTIDFTLREGNPNVTMKVIGTTETPTWSVKDPEIATISETGVVKYVAKGKTIVTATIGGQTLTCDVYCK